MRLARPLENLIDQLIKLPTIGPKTAQRLALYILKLPKEEASKLADAIKEVAEIVKPCSQCGYLTDSDPCAICRDQERDDTLLCITEETSDVIAIDKTGDRGRYMVLNKDFHLMDGDGLEDINLTPLMEKLNTGTVKELILAMNPDIEGDVISRFIAGIANRFGIKITRLAHGLPVGGNIEFADEITLRRAIEGRKEL